MKLVYIEWQDAHGVSSNWEWLSDLEKHAGAVCIVKSVGYLLNENKHNVVIIPHLIEPTSSIRGQGCGDMTIPKGCIQRMVSFNLPRDPLNRDAKGGRRRRSGKQVPQVGVNKTPPPIGGNRKHKPQGSV